MSSFVPSIEGWSSLRGIYYPVILGIFTPINRSLDTLQAQISEWSRLDDLTQLISYPSIYRKLLASLRSCAAVSQTFKSYGLTFDRMSVPQYSHQCAASVHTKKLLDQDLISAAALLVVILRNRDRKKSLYVLDESKARNLINLMHKISNLSDLDSKIRSVITEAMFTISRKHRCYPECLVLHGVEYSERAVAGGGFGDIWKGQVRGRTIAIKVMRIFGEHEIQKFLKVFRPATHSFCTMSNQGRSLQRKQFYGRGCAIRMYYPSTECIVGKPILAGSA
jgi:hypothetical protein